MPDPDPIAYRLAAAAIAVSNGWPITPLRGKIPLMRQWTTQPPPSPQQARQWAADGNVGLRTGRVSGIYVIDRDRGGDLVPLNLPDTLTVETGSGGLHLYYQMPAGMTLGNTSGKLGPKLDTRGDGGQVVYPGSIHPVTGRMYRWANDLPIAPLPASVIAALTSRPRAVPAPSTAYARRALEGELAAVIAAPSGEGSAALNKAAFSLGQLVGGGQLDEAEVVEALVRASTPRRPEQEARATVMGAVAAGRLQPRMPRGRPATQPKPPQPKPATDDTRGEILTPGPYTTDVGEYGEVGAHEFVRAVLEALPEDAIYSRAGIIGELAGLAGQVTFRPLTARRMQAVIDAAVRLVRWAVPRKGTPSKVYVSCTRDLAETVLGSALSFGTFRALKMLVSYPVYLRPGFRPAPAGWDAASGVYYDRPESLAGMTPVRDERVIRETLADLIVDFPFDSDASRQNFIGLLLTPLLRPALDGNTPLHLIESSIERAGKGKLIEQVMGRIIVGRPVPAMQYQDNETDRDKTILSLLLCGTTIVHLDNLSGFIDSSALASLVTAASYRGRVLGHSVTAEIDNTFTVAATGNNVRMSSELVKRTVPIMLRPADDHPEYRTDFTHRDLSAYLDSVRPGVLGCLLGAIDNWRDAGCVPLDEMPLGGFETWARTVGGVLWTAGLTSWRTGSDAWRASADTEGEDLKALVQAWAERHGEGMCRTEDVYLLAEELGLFTVFMTGKSAEANRVKFGMRVLRRYENRPVSCWRITRYPGSKRGIWKLTTTEHLVHL